MRRLAITLIAILGFMVVVASAQEATPSVEADTAAIQQLWASYETYVETGNLDAWMGLWMEGGVQMPPGSPPNVGLEMIRNHADIAPSDDAIAMHIDAQEITILGDWAYSRGLYTVDVTPAAGGAAQHVDGKFMTILRRQEDGSWKIYRDIFNSNGQPD